MDVTCSPGHRIQVKDLSICHRSYTCNRVESTLMRLVISPVVLLLRPDVLITSDLL